MCVLTKGFGLLTMRCTNIQAVYFWERKFFKTFFALQNNICFDFILIWNLNLTWIATFELFQNRFLTKSSSNQHLEMYLMTINLFLWKNYLEQQMVISVQLKTLEHNIPKCLVQNCLAIPRQFFFFFLRKYIKIVKAISK